MKAHLRFVVALLVGAAALSILLMVWQRSHQDEASQSGEPTIEAIHELASLLTHRIDVSDAYRTRIRGFLGSAHCAVLVKGDVLLTIDLTGARYTSKDPNLNTAILLLPQPVATSPRVDHRRTRLISVERSGLWQFNPLDSTRLDLINRTYEQAQQELARVASSEKLIAQSRNRAEQLIGAYGRSLGWKIVVRWQTDPVPGH